MRILTIAALLVVAACSTTKEKTPPPPVLTNDSFKKEKPLNDKEVKDFYTANIGTMSPALQDETLDRHSNEELAAAKDLSDPLLTMAVLCKRGDFGEAFALAGRSYNRFQKVAAYWNQIANCHLNQGGHRKALLFYNKALEVHPEYVPALNNIGVLYSRQGQDQKALVAFERANKKSRFAKTPRYNLGKLYLSYGLVEQALPLLQSLLNESPNDVDLLNSVASAQFLKSDYDAALQTFQRIPGTQWAAPEVGLNVAFTLSKLGRKADAAKVFAGVKPPESPALKKYYSTVKEQL